MPWQPLPRIAFAVATYPFTAQEAADLPLELGDELYIIEQGGRNGEWFRGYLVAPPSLLAGLTSVKGQTLEARVFSGIFPRSCVEVREVLGEDEEEEESDTEEEVEVSIVDRKRGVSVDADGSPLASPTSIQPGKKPRVKSNGITEKTTVRENTKMRLTNGSALFVDTPRDSSAPKPPAPVPMLKIGDETPTSASEPLVDEIASCLREWHSTNLHELLLSRQYPLLDKMTTLVQNLDLSRRQFLHNVLTAHEMSTLREKTVWDLVKGNKIFNGEVIVRDPAVRGRVLTGDDSAVDITKLQSMMSLLEERPQPVANESLTLHHLLLDVRTFVGASTESTTLVFFLASKTPGQSAFALSESYIMEVPPSGAMTSLAKAGQMRTLFTDLASSDIGDVTTADSELYLVVKIQSTQQVIGGQPVSRGGLSSRDDSQTQSRDKPPSASGSKSGRRSLMWGQKAQRSFSRNSPMSSKLNPLTEGHESREGPPNTTDSYGPTERKSSAVSRVVSKTLGIGALRINSLMKQDDEIEQVVQFWAPATGFGQEKQFEEGFEEVIKDLMSSKSGNYAKSRRAERLQVHLKAFQSPDADDLIEATPTILSGVSKTSKMGFSGAPIKARSDIYFTIDEAFLPRHALISRAMGSATPLSSTILGSNLQITLQVCHATGERLENCIFPSSNSETPVSSWESTAAEKGDAWNQTIRLAIPPIDVAGCHLVLTLADAPGSPFAICHLPLWDQSAFVRDGHHSLLLYRYDDQTNAAKGREGRLGYLNTPWNARGKDDVSKDEAVTGPIATLRVQTFLCSTRFSQDKVLLGLLKWKEQPPGDVQELLKRLVFVPEIEIVKLLNDVFDAIFGILVEHTGNDDYEDLIFGALVTVLGIVHDRRFNLGPLVDHYAENKFNYPFVTPCLVRSFTRLLSNPADPDTSRKLRATFKVVRHILKFITHARGQQIAKEAGIGITSTSPGFTRHLRSIFKALDGLMRSNAPILVGSQTLAVQHFHTWLPELSGLLSAEEILHIAIDFMDACSLVKGKLVLYKLVLIIYYSRLDIFANPEQLEALSANTVRWIAPHWGKTAEVTEQWREQVRLCCSILSTQIENLATEIPDYIPKIVDSYLSIRAGPKPERSRLSLLFPLTYPFPAKAITGKVQFDEVLVELSAILSSISTTPAGMQLDLGDDEMAALLEDILHVHLSILDCEAFPANWLSVHIFHHKSAMKTLEYVAGILLESFLPDPDDAESYNTEVWKAFFSVLLKLVGSDALALETFPEQKRRAVWKIAGDVREHGAELLRRTWEAIGWETSSEERQRYGLANMGGYQVQYVPVLVGPIVELCLSVHEGLRRVAVEVLQTMIVSEWTLSEDLSVIQTEMIDCLDRLFESKPLTESILQKLFINELLGLFDPLAQCGDDSLYADLREFIATIDEFLDLLVAVHSADVTGEASHMIHRLRLMEFLRDMQKEEIFIRYVHQLAQLQADARNPTEAGLALRLHADIYEWDPTKIVPPLTDPEFPAQSQFDRKERIYFEIIKYFEEGEAWSSALSLYQELQSQYQENVFDFPKLARTQRAIATIYETIAKADKIVPKYFRVTFRGMGFPPSFRDKEFVFQGSPTERTSAFTDRMQEQHPSAQIVSAGDVDDVEGQFLQISALTPHRDLEHHVYQRARIPQVVRDYFLSAHPQVFSVTSKRNTAGPAQDHSAEKILYTTLEAFPTILRRSEIVAVDRVGLNALQTAVERIIRKTTEMSVVEKRVIDGEEDMAPLLIDALQISVNPNSETTVAKYRALLPVASEEDDFEEPELDSLQNALKMALIDHAVMIRRSLAMLSKTPAIGSVEREAVVQNFEVTFAPELASFAFPQKAKSPTPTSSWAIASPVLSDVSRRDSQTLSNRLSAMNMTPRVPNSSTNGTLVSSSSVDTNVLDTPGARAGRNRLSFLKRTQPAPRSPTQQSQVQPEPMLNGLSLNGVSHKDFPVVPVASGRRASSTADGEDEEEISTSTRSRSKSQSKDNMKENRRSFFGGSSGLSSIGRGRGRNGNEKEEENEWITQSDLASQYELGISGLNLNANANTYTNGNSNGGEIHEAESKGRRSTSSSRPMTGKSAGEGLRREGSVGRKVGNVRKRLSRLTLGKKSSKQTLMVGSVAEED
ncbi:related to dock180 protein [Rhynchosporium agropyri]|uniref:Related to dock180 protein n=1 Tax=Rhynchosporium agropyri TaxID=914238 RepID=A0A1E1L1A5_9HELO|nr:related to dock180 protein [Rhynchosporium agropyri]